MTLVSAYTADFRNLYKGLQSHQLSDLKQQVSALLEKQLRNSNAYASLINLPASLAIKTPSKHPPLTATCSVKAAASLVREHRKLDRSVSEPVDKSQSRPIATPTSSRYKTELCRPFEESGTCKYGDKCQFAHGQGELRTLSRHPKYKTELCRTFHSTGFCPYGPRCHFIHNSCDDAKRCLLSSLKNRDCDGMSIGSAGELSPGSSRASSSISGSPTSSLGGFFLDECMPHTAPPTLTNPGFFGTDYKQPLASPPPCLASPPLQPLASPPLQHCEEFLSSSSPPAKEMEYNSDSDPEMDGCGRNNIRLPIFSQLSLGSSP